MRSVKAHNFLAVLRGLLLLGAGGYFLVKTTAPAIYTLIDNIVGNSYDGGVFILAPAISYCINLSVAATASRKGKGNFSAIVLAVSALALGISGALAFNGVDGSGYVYMAAICAGALMLILSSFFLIAGNVKRKREEQERQRRLIERERADRMRARRAYGYR